MLLGQHVSPSKLLDVLERSTQTEVQYTHLGFSRRPSGNVSVDMTGIAPRFNTVARQAQRFADEKQLFDRVIFSSLNKPDPNFVTFGVNLDISKASIAYQAHSAPDSTTTTDVVNTVPVNNASTSPDAPTTHSPKPTKASDNAPL